MHSTPREETRETRRAHKKSPLKHTIYREMLKGRYDPMKIVKTPRHPEGVEHTGEREREERSSLSRSLVVIAFERDPKQLRSTVMLLNNKEIPQQRASERDYSITDPFSSTWTRYTYIHIYRVVLGTSRKNRRSADILLSRSIRPLNQRNTPPHTHTCMYRYIHIRGPCGERERRGRENVTCVWAHKSRAGDYKSEVQRY